jgi:hypothetical protein
VTALDTAAGVNLRVEYTYDPESRTWCFRVPSLHIIGGADTRDEAEQEAVAAVLVTLEYEATGENLPADVAEALAVSDIEIASLRVTVRRPEREGSAAKRRSKALRTGA